MSPVVIPLSAGIGSLTNSVPVVATISRRAFLRPVFSCTQSRLLPCGFASVRSRAQEASHAHILNQSGRQRFNVLGAWDAVTRQLIDGHQHDGGEHRHDVRVAPGGGRPGLAGPVTLVLDNARYQRNDVVQALAKELGIELLFLPSYSPNLNLIERLWRFTKRKAVYGRYHPTFADFRAAIEDVLDGSRRRTRTSWHR